MRCPLPQSPSFLSPALIDRIHLFIAPFFFGSGGVPAFALASGLTGLAFADATLLGSDALVTLERAQAA